MSKKYPHGKLETTDALFDLFDALINWIACRVFKYGCEDNQDDDG